ncbi:MAG: T9SS type A sorting domain-containing protein [Flavipsychrobacter sp.]|nr:T9SS type A sorting domain-containing protein [Flavipsychrobacter sp.]
MKIKTLLLFILFPITLSAQWTKTAGPVETDATAIEIAGTRLYLGTNSNGLFTSLDSGVSWKNVATYPDSAAPKTINRLVYHYNPFMFASYLFVANTDHIYSSMDNGISFQYADTSLPDTLKNFNLFNVNGSLYSTAQVVDPVTFNTNTELFYFNDYTSLWQQVNNLPTGYQVTSVAALHDTLYCAVFGHGIYRTHNNGFMWDSLNVANGLLASNNIRLLATYGQELYAMAYDNSPVLYVTTNALTWTSVLLSFTGGNIINNITVFKKTICLGSPGAIYISKDDGTNWNSTTLPYYSINEAKFSGTGIIAADPGNGFLHTSNDTTWTASNKGLNYSGTSHLAYPYSNVYAMDGFNTFHTGNHGNSWAEDTDILFNMSGMTRMGDKIIGFSKYGQNDLYSYDQGTTWKIETTPGVGILVSKSIVDNTNRQIYTWGQADIRRSDDYGITWKSLFYPNANSYHDTLFTSLAKTKTRLWATVTDPAPKLIYSDDEGNHWSEGVLGYQIYSVVNIDSVLLLGTSSGIKKTTDIGANFTTVYGGDLFSTYVNGTTIFNFKGPYANSIQYSTDYGSTWTDISIPDSAGSVNDLVMDENYLYAATNDKSVWRRSLSNLGITYTPDTTNNYGVGVNLLTKNEKPAVSIFPNPYTDNFNVLVTTTATHYIGIKMYDAIGRCVQTLAQNTYGQGVHAFSAGTGLASGIYYVTVIVDDSIATKKVVRY